MSALVIIDEYGNPLVWDKPTTLIEDVTDCAWDMVALAKVAEEEARKASTNKEK